MSRTDSRDRAIEGELRRQGVAPSGASAECLDAETLAAWADGALGGGVRARAEVHVASCARCQSILAAIVTSGDALGPAPADTRRAAWWRVNLRWLVPLAGAATAGLVWAVVPDQRGNRLAPMEDAQTQVVEQAPAAAPPPITTPSESPARDAAARAPQASERYMARAEPVSPPVNRQSLDTRQTSKRERENQEQNRNAADRLAKTEAPSPPVAGVTPAAPTVPSEPSRAEADRPAAAAPAPATQAFATEARQLSASRSSIDLKSATATVRWRIANLGIVERSRDGGVSWERLDTGVRTLLVAGSCPSASICWVVGNAGVVLLTTDARTWQRVSAPTAADLVAVDAQSDRRAVVHTAAGLQYETRDGGATWK